MQFRFVFALAVCWSLAWLVTEAGPAGAQTLAGKAAPPASGTPPPAAAPKSAPPAPATRPVVIHDIATRLDLRAPFNADQGKIRILAFLSPTCGHCFVNAQAFQKEVLDALPDANIAVYVVWLKVLDSDNRAAINAAATVLHDARIRHYWDPKHTMNAQLLDGIYVDVQVRMYNVFLLYDGHTTWETHLPRAGYWMQDYRGVPAPQFKASTMLEEVNKALRGERLDTPEPP
jgi:hypothetical protein